MSRYSKKHTASPETLQEAEQIAKGTQRPGQTKEQTRLIAQGIQKGIEQYKKQHKAKAREQDKRRKQMKSSEDSVESSSSDEQVVYKQHWLPWMLLVISWLAVGFYLLTVK